MSTTIVSAYYEIPSKQPHSQYLIWVEYFLKNIKTNTVFYTTYNLIDTFQNIRNENIIYKILPFEELDSYTKYSYNFWKKHKDLEPHNYHTPELGIIWREKKEFVKRVIEENPFNSKNFIWCDAGCVRDERYFSKINSFGNNLSLFQENKLNIQLISNLQNKKFYTYPDIIIAGAIMGGTKNAWLSHSEKYDEILTEYDENNIPVISDQYIIASSVEKYPELYSCILPKNDSYIDKWFFLLEDLL